MPFGYQGWPLRLGPTDYSVHLSRVSEASLQLVIYRLPFTVTKSKLLFNAAGTWSAKKDCRSEKLATSPCIYVDQPLVRSGNFPPQHYHLQCTYEVSCNTYGVPDVSRGSVSNRIVDLFDTRYSNLLIATGVYRDPSYWVVNDPALTNGGCSVVRFENIAPIRFEPAKHSRGLNKVDMFMYIDRKTIRSGANHGIPAFVVFPDMISLVSTSSGGL